MLPRLFSEVFHGVWAMHKEGVDGFLPFLSSILKGEFQQNTIDLSVNGKVSGMRFLNWSHPEEDPMDVPIVVESETASQDSISILNVIGPLIKYDYCGSIGTNTMEKLLDEAEADPYVKGHIIWMDTPGGEAYASMSMARKVKSLKKPKLGFISDLAASGGYNIISACDYIVANSAIAQIGSIGTYRTFQDYAKYFEMNGVVNKEVYATKSTEKNIETREAQKGNFKPMIERINRVNEEFLIMVKENRGDKLGDESIWGKGKLFFADESFAEESGLIDDIGTFEEAFQSFVQNL